MQFQKSQMTLKFFKYVYGQNKMTTEQGQEKECQNP